MDEEVDANDLKKRVNNFLWTALPPSTSIGDADRIALEFWERIMKEWQAVPKPAKESRNG